jgi:hypothetical protein
VARDPPFWAADGSPPIIGKGGPIRSICALTSSDPEMSGIPGEPNRRAVPNLEGAGRHAGSPAGAAVVAAVIHDAHGLSEQRAEERPAQDVQ